LQIRAPVLFDAGGTADGWLSRVDFDPPRALAIEGRRRQAIGSVYGLEQR